MSKTTDGHEPARPHARWTLAVTADAAAARLANEDPLLTQAELAEYLSVSARTARTIMEERRITVVAIGRSLRVRQSAADAYIVACTQPAARPVRTDSYGRDVWLRPTA